MVILHRKGSAMIQPDKNVGSHPIWVFWTTLAAVAAIIVLGVLFAYVGWWGGLPVYPPPSQQEWR
jgi:hypothetical protein